MPSPPHKIAIPRFGESVAPCYGYSATVAIFTIEDGAVVQQTDFTLSSRRVLDRVRLLRDQGVDTLICGGVQDRFEDIIRANGIQVLSWVSGNVELLLQKYLRGEIGAETDDADQPGATIPEIEKGGRHR